MWWTHAPERGFGGSNDVPPAVSLYEADTGEWDRYVDSHPAASFYHLIAWRRVIEDSCPHRCLYLIARRHGAAAGVLPLTLVRSRLFGTYLVSPAFGDVGGICADDWDTGEALLKAASHLRQQCRAEYIELRHINPLPCEDLKTSCQKVMPILALPNSEGELWKRFGPKLRNQIRKGEKADLKPVWGSAELVKDFYRVYAQNMRDLGTPVISIKFFSSVIREFGEKARILMLYRKEQPVSGAIGICYRNTFEVPWASSRRDCFSLNPNNRLYWEMLRWCIERGIGYFNFGRSSFDSGAYRFKEQWNPTIYNLHYQFSGSGTDSASLRDPKVGRYDLAVRLWKKMPLGLSVMIGPWLARDLT